MESIHPDVEVRYGFDCKYHSMLWAAPLLLKKMEKYKDYDLVIAGLEIWPTYMAMLFSALHSIPSIAWVHTNLKFIMNRYSLPKRCFFNICSGISYHTMDHIFSVSKSCRVSKDFRKNIVVPNSFDKDFILHQSEQPIAGEEGALFKKEGPFILSVSRLAAVKNIQLLIRAHAKLFQEGIKQEIIVVGMGDELPKLKKLCRELGVSDTVHFLGGKMNPYPYFKKCDVFVNCSRVEGFSLTGMEALLLRVPLITTDYPNACSELVENNVSGLVVKNNSVDELANGIRKLLEDGALRQKLIRNGTIAVERFDEKRIIEEIQNHFYEYAKE